MVMDDIISKEKSILEQTHRNRDALSEGDRSWIVATSTRKALYRLIKLWICCEETWNTLVGDIISKPEEEHN